MVTGGFEDDTALHNLRRSKHISTQLAFHPEEMRKYRPCFLTGGAPHVEQDSHLMIKRDARPGASCSKACHRFNRSAVCSDGLRSRACEATDWSEVVRGAEMQHAFASWMATNPRPSDGELQLTVTRLLRDLRATTTSLGREAFVTVVSSNEGTDYLSGLLGLAATLADTGTTRPLLVLLSGPISPAISHASACLNFTVVPVRPIENFGAGRLVRNVARFNDTFNKLHAFGLPAERVVLLDADTLVLQNIDELFARPGHAEVEAVPDLGQACRGERRCVARFAKGDHFNSGVLLLRPSAQLFRELYASRWTITSDDGGDQGLLNAFFKGRTGAGRGSGRLPARYNTFASEELLRPNRFSMGSVSVLHYAGLKPWHRRAQIGA